MIEIRSLTKRFGAFTAVDAVSFKVERGCVLGFLGPNGAGKSTTMKMLTGFLPPTSGTALVDGHDVQTAPLEVKRRIGYLPEGAPLYPDMTPRGLLAFVGDLRRMPTALRKARTAEVVGLVHLEKVLDVPIETLSKGYKRRVGLAQAILHDPEVLVLDEPTDGLDPNQKHEVRRLIRSMAKDKVIVLSTHILEEVEAVCTRTIIIHDGKLVVDCTPDELAARSHTHNAVSMSVEGDEAARVASGLRDLSVVAEVQEMSSQNGRARVLAVPRDGKSIITAVSQAVRDQQWNVEEVRVERGRLDDVFRQLTGGAARRDA